MFDRKRYMKEYRKKNEDKLSQQTNVWRRNNSEKVKLYNKNYRKKYPEKKKISNKKWYENNKEKAKKYGREDRLKNRRKYLEYSKKYYHTHKEEHRIYDKTEKRIKQKRDYHKKWYLRNKKSVIQNTSKYSKIKYNSDKNFNIQVRIRQLFKLALRKYSNEGKIMVAKKYGIDYNAIIEYLKPFPEDTSKYHIDHIRPLCSFTFVNKDGSQNIDEIKKAFAPENHQWLLASKNISKGGRWNGE